jgi:hypothetical protein
MLKHGPGNGQRVNAGTVRLAKTLRKDSFYYIKICFHVLPDFVLVFFTVREILFLVFFAGL